MNFYNDIDPKACAWTRELIAQGSTPPGDVVCKSILEVTAGELKNYEQCHFFNGIAGWAEALRLAGWPTRRPVWCASLPCQPFSAAGQQKGASDDRHLWPAFFNLVKQQHPECIFGEQVAAAIGFDWLDGISADLEAEGYRVGAVVLGAHSVGAPQRRQRLYWVADSGSKRLRRLNKSDKQTAEGRCASDIRSANGGMVLPNGAGRITGQLASEAAGYGGSAESTGGVSAVADANKQRPQKQRGVRKVSPSQAAPIQGQAIERVNASVGALGNAERNGSAARLPESPQRQEGNAGEFNDASGSLGFWDAHRIIQTSDGKARRIPVEPAFFPLVDGFPARVAVLKGFGNAIIPQVAAQFIQAYLETLEL